jgi:CRISPR-associated protein Csm1
LDVDNLGRIFSTGLAEGDRTLSRKASLSRQFSLFFKYHINGVLDINRKDGYETFLRVDSSNRRGTASRAGRSLSLVYSGGDDVFVIGHWLDCLEAAFDVNEAFHRFTGNPGITVSGGFALGDVHQPVYRFAEESGEDLDAAKAGGRNAIRFLGGTFRWVEAVDIIRLVRGEILPLLSLGDSSLVVPAGSFAKGFLFRLLVLIRSHTREKVWILPKAAYLAGRNGPNLSWLEKNGKAREAWMALRNRLFSLEDKGHRKLETALVWTLMMLRKGGGQDDTL